MSYRTTSTTQSGHVTTRVARTNSRFSRTYSGLLASLGFASFLLVSAPALAATAPDLKSNNTYAIVSDTFTNALNAGLETKIVGAVCYNTGPSTPPNSISG